MAIQGNPSLSSMLKRKKGYGRDFEKKPSYSKKGQI
jgi:hypothetical protein